MSKNNKKLDEKKYDIDKEYVEGENYGLKELVRILEHNNDIELANSKVYNKLNDTIGSKWEKDFHIDINKFKEREDKEALFYYLQFLKVLYSVEYPRNKKRPRNINAKKPRNKNAKKRSEKNIIKSRGVFKSMSWDSIKDKNPKKSST